MRLIQSYFKQLIMTYYLQIEFNYNKSNKDSLHLKIMNQTQNNSNNLNSNSNFSNNQNPNQYLFSKIKNVTIGKMIFSDLPQTKDSNMNSNNINNSATEQKVFGFTVNYFDKYLNSTISNETSKFQDTFRRMEMAKLFCIIYPIINKDIINSYFLTCSLVPSTESKKVLFSKYGLIYQQYFRMCNSLLRSYLPYISPQFRSGFNRKEGIISILKKTWWTIFIGTIIYGSKRLNYKWKHLTISPRFGFYSFIFLFAFADLRGLINQGLNKDLIKKNINEFDSIVKTQNQILVKEKIIQYQSQSQSNSTTGSSSIINEKFANYQTVQQPAKSVF